MLYEDYVAAQIAMQTKLRRFRRGVPLNFAPFEVELAKFEGRAAEIARLVKGSDIAALSEMLRAKTLTAFDLTLHYLRRIRRMQNLNAVLELNPDALALAAAADRSAAFGDLHGIPILIKDNIGTGDRMHTTAGADVLRHARADRDALLVSRLRASGAVLLGKTNLSEWANFFANEAPPNGFSANGGQTRNPYGLHDVGGSSAGSAAAAAAGLCAAAVGTETHGSIVYPSLCNGLYGLKPSIGLISRDRVIPITDATDTAGPMARTATDMAVLMDVMMSHDPQDAAYVEAAADPRGAALLKSGLASALAQDGLRGRRIGLARTRDGGETYRAAFAGMRAALRAAGAVVVSVTLPKFRSSFIDIMSHGYVHGLASYFEATGAPVHSAHEVAEYNRRDMAHRAPNGMGRLERALQNSWTHEEYAANVHDARARAREVIETTLRDHELDFIATFSPLGFDERFVMAGAPLLALPGGFLPNGRPYGFTLGARWLEDAALVAAAGAWERECIRRRG